MVHSGLPLRRPLQEGERLPEWTSPLSAAPAFVFPGFVSGR